MAHAMASIGGLIGSSQTVLDGSLQLSGSARLSTVSTSRIASSRSGLIVRAQQGSVDVETSRRAVIGLVAAGLASSFAQAAFAEARAIKVGPAPPPSGGLRKSSCFWLSSLFTFLAFFPIGESISSFIDVPVFSISNIYRIYIV